MDLAELKKRIQKLAQKISRNKDMWEEVGKVSAREVQKRTRLGYGVKEKGGKKEKLAPLSDGYKKQRKKMRLHSEATASKSNLTLTGQMIDAITYNTTQKGVTIKFDSAEARQKANWAHDGSSNRPKRPFFTLTNLEIKRVRKLIMEYVAKEIKKIL